MEKFKAVEKAMKTKAYSKEGLSAAAKLDPKERAKMEACEFLNNQVEELERQIETLEAEGESIQATMKKGKNQNSKADRMAEIERITERHKWHQGKLELIKRSLENGGVETEQVNDLEETIRYYVTDGMNDDFMEDEEMYDDLNLEEEEDAYGIVGDNDRVSSQDTQSVQEEAPETDSKPAPAPSQKSKTAATTDAAGTGRRPSTQMKSPLPALALLNPSSNLPNGASNSNMKPAAVPTRAPGETLKYASAAAAAAASDKNLGIAPLPPPPESIPTPTSAHPSVPVHAVRGQSAAASPTILHSQPASVHHTPVTRASLPVQSNAQTRSPALSHSSTGPTAVGNSTSQTGGQEKAEQPTASRGPSGKAQSNPGAGESSKGTIPPDLMWIITDQVLFRALYISGQWCGQQLENCNYRRFRRIHISPPVSTTRSSTVV